MKARSFIHFDDFDTNGFLGKRITAASLKLYHTWSYDCTTHQPFYVHRVNDAWTVANLSSAAPSQFPGRRSRRVRSGPYHHRQLPGLHEHGRQPEHRQVVECAVGGGHVQRLVDRGDEQRAGLVGFREVSTGGSVSPQRTTLLELTSRIWNSPTPTTSLPRSMFVTGQQCRSADADSGASRPGEGPDHWPNKGFTYNYSIFDATTLASVVSSGWISTASWTVPAGNLAWNKSYLYTVQVFDKAGYSAVSPAYAFTVSVPQPIITSNLAQNSGKGFDPSNGNYTTSATDASVATVGPSLSITRSYNSLDVRRTGAFGAGWSSLLDSRATQVVDVAGVVQSVRVTYPTGQDVAFGRNSDGSFTAPSGRFAVLKENKDGGGNVIGYTLTDKDASVFAFGHAAGGGVFTISALTDANYRSLTVQYDRRRVCSVTSASGRYLDVAWSTPSGSTYPHVSTVATDPAIAGDNNSIQTWQYGYGSGDRADDRLPADEHDGVHHLSSRTARRSAPTWFSTSIRTRIGR